MKKIERILIAALALGLAGLLVTQLTAEQRQDPTASRKLSNREVIDITPDTMIMGAGRFEIKKVLMSEGQRETLIRFDSATGDYAILDTQLGAWVRVELPTVKPAGQYENDAHIKLIDDVVFN